MRARRRHWGWAAGFLLLALLAAGGWWLCSMSSSQEVAFAMKLNPGWNLANTLDAHGLGAGAGEPSVYEQYWGSEPVSREEIAAIAQAGFRTLRVPVTWFEHMDAEQHIDPAWMNRVRTVVDWALEAGMYVIVNAHHDAWYAPEPENLSRAEATLRTVWEQIAACFADVDERLLFESMNEPRLIGTPEEWTAGTPEARAGVNQLNAAFVETIRAAGGGNATRYLLLPTYCASVLPEALDAVTLPPGRHLMLSAHLYIPYDFTLNEQGTAAWNPQRSEDTREIVQALEHLARRFVKRGVGVVLTEFGAVDKQNEEARTAWADEVLMRAAAARIPCMWWDTSLLNQHTLTWRYPKLLQALVSPR